jgi:hypothetical protein
MTACFPRHAAINTPVGGSISLPRRADGGPRPTAMDPYTVAMLAAFVAGGILAKAVPLWLVAVTGLAIGAAVFVFADRDPRLPRSGQSPARSILAEEARSCSSRNLEAISRVTGSGCSGGQGGLRTLKRNDRWARRTGPASL